MPSKYPELFAELGRPIPESAVKVRSQGGRQLHYITARTVMNRLDTVMGPENWWAEFFPHGQHGVLCKLSIRLPDGQIVSKCDVGGYAGMADGGDDEKSAASDATKRAGVMFGIGRELYGDGNAVAELVSITAKVEAKLGSSTRNVYRVEPRQYADPETDREGFRNDVVQTLRESGTLRTGAEVFGKPPVRDDAPPDDLLDPAERPDFRQYVEGACKRWQTKLASECVRRKLPAPPPSFTPEYAAICYCDELIRTGSLNAIEVVDSASQFDDLACLNTAAGDYANDPDAVSRCVEKYLESQYHGVIGNLERDAHESEYGKPPNRAPRADDRPPAQPSGGGRPGTPRNGRSMFAAVKDLEKQTGASDLVRWVANHCKANKMPERMVDLSDDQVREVWAALNEMVAEQVPA